MNRRHLLPLLAVLPFAACTPPAAADAKPGAGKHIVLLAGDEEYRSEEALPALGRILQRQGFKCTVCFSAEADGTMPASSARHVRCHCRRRCTHRISEPGPRAADVPPVSPQ